MDKQHQIVIIGGGTAGIMTCFILPLLKQRLNSSKESNLVNDAGWLSVDHGSMQHTEFKNIFGLGDVAGLPTAKTGAAIRKQVPIVVDNLMLLLAHKEATNKSYNGYSSCPLSHWFTEKWF